MTWQSQAYLTEEGQELAFNSLGLLLRLDGVSSSAKEASAEDMDCSMQL